MGKLLPSELLEQGWTQWSTSRQSGSGRTVKMRYCLAGAVRKYNQRESFLGKFLRVAQEILFKKMGPGNVCHPITWNDESGRTQEEVVALAKEVEERLGLRPVATTSKPEPEEEPKPEPTSPAPEPEPEGDETTPLVEEDRVLVGVGD